MSGKVYGYVRVSTKEQHTDRQLIAMENFGVPSRHIFIDRQSGKDFERREYQRLLDKLGPDDTIVVKSIDRLGRNYAEIIEQWRIITKEKRAAIVVFDMPLLDTRKDKDLIGTLLADVVLQLLSFVAEMERDFIRQRQAEGIAAAQARGVRFGRSPIEKPDIYQTVYERWKCGEMSVRKAGKLLGVTHGTFLKWTKAPMSLSSRR